MKYAVLLILGAAVAACGSPHEPATRDNTPPTPVTIAVARTQPAAATFEAGGSVRSRTVAVLSSRIVAPVLEVRVREGDRVRSGQPVVLLDGRELRAAVVRADAALAAAREGSAAAAAEQRAAASGLTLATATHKRIAGLRERNSATPAELDDAVAALETAQARAGGSEARKLESERAIEAAQAGARAAAVTQSYATLTAPFDGVVTVRSADPGNLAAPGTPLVTVEEADRFRMEVTVDASRAASIANGARVPVAIDGFSAPLDGVIAEIGQAVDPVTHMFTVKIDLPPTAGLRSGLFGRARLTGAAQPVLSVPASAMIRRGQLTMVFVEDAGVARMRLVHAGAPADSGVPILAGLSDGEHVIVNPPAGITDGMKVSAGRQR